MWEVIYRESTESHQQRTPTVHPAHTLLSSVHINLAGPNTKATRLKLSWGRSHARVVQSTDKACRNHAEICHGLYSVFTINVLQTVRFATVADRYAQQKVTRVGVRLNWRPTAVLSACIPYSAIPL